MIISAYIFGAIISLAFRIFIPLQLYKVVKGKLRWWCW